MENRSRLAHAPIIAWLLALLLNWHTHCLAGQSTPPPGNESLTLKANDPTASLTQFEVKDEYTPSEFGTNAQPNTLTLRGILAVYPRGPLNLEQLIRPCTILTIANGRWTGFWKNKKDALSTSPQAGFLDRSQSLWALWTTPSSESRRETDRVLR